MFIRRIFSILLVLMPALTNAQSSPKWLIEAADEAEFVVEGAISDQQSFYDSTRQTIYTVHTVASIYIFKGTAATEYFHIRTEGGCVNGICQTLSHNVRLGKNEKGIYLLKERVETSKNQKIKHYDLVGGDRIKRIAGSSEMEGYYQSRVAKFPSWRKLKENLSLLCGQAIVSERLKKSQLDNLVETQFCVKIDNARPVFGQKKVEFDIYAKSNIDGLEFEGIDLVCSYPADVLGEYIVSDGKVALQPEVISDHAIYALSLADI